jgi:hypothetical protein
MDVRIFFGFVLQCHILSVGEDALKDIRYKFLQNL